MLQNSLKIEASQKYSSSKRIHKFLKPDATISQNSLILELQTANSSENSDFQDCQILYLSEKFDGQSSESFFLSINYGDRLISSRMIQCIKFFNLKTLDLAGNCLVSIEPLSRINAHNLKFLILTDNFLHQLSSLIKMNCIHLQKIEYDINYSRECDRFYQGNWPKLSQMNFDRIQYFIRLYSWNLPFEDPKFLFKMQTKLLQKIYFNCLNRIGSSTLENSLKKKFVNSKN